jgi:hypothetical protein
LAELWTSLIEGPNSEAVRWPLRRFGVARQRAFAEDRLIDLAIALVAIYDPERLEVNHEQYVQTGREP